MNPVYPINICQIFLQITLHYGRFLTEIVKTIIFNKNLNINFCSAKEILKVNAISRKPFKKFNHNWNKA